MSILSNVVYFFGYACAATGVYLEGLVYGIFSKIFLLLCNDVEGDSSVSNTK